MLSFRDLCLQYEQCLEQQERVIARNRCRLQRAERDCDHLEVRRLNALLRVLYEERSELQERTDELREYLQN